MLSDISYSKDLRTEENLHLATKGSKRERTAVETLRKWNRFLNNCGLPEVDVVGTGLPDALRNLLSIAAATIVEMSRTDFASWNANILIGGAAIAAHGAPRDTEDVDVAVSAQALEPLVLAATIGRGGFRRYPELDNEQQRHQ